jgi:ketosteroid isomerase-like protein
MAQGFREHLIPWEDLRVKAEEYRELDAERVLVLYTLDARGKSSGLEASQIRTKGAQLFHVREGKVTRLVQYLELEDAFADLGLAPETGSLTSANLDLVRSIHAAWERGDYSSADWADPDIEYVHADGPDAGSWSGLAGMAQAFRDFLSAWEEFRVEAGEYRELDAERVLVLFTFAARGKSSGLEASQIRTKGAQLFHVREGKVTRLVQYFELEDALADLGLAPETG